jgi:hypothetical protein
MPNTSHIARLRIEAELKSSRQEETKMLKSTAAQNASSVPAQRVDRLPGEAIPNPNGVIPTC